MENVTVTQDDQVANIQNYMDAIRNFSGTNPLKSISTPSFLQQYKVNGRIPTILKDLGFISKNGIVKWNPEIEVSYQNASLVLSESKLYDLWSQEKAGVENLFLSTEKYPINFEKMWPLMGFTLRENAKRSLLTFCKNGEDYYSVTTDGITGKIEDKRADFEIIRLSVTGLLTWGWNAQTVIAKTQIRKLQSKFLQGLIGNNILANQRDRERIHLSFLYEFTETFIKEVKLKMKEMEARKEYLSRSTFQTELQFSTYDFKNELLILIKQKETELEHGDYLQKNHPELPLDMDNSRNPEDIGYEEV